MNVDIYRDILLVAACLLLMMIGVSMIIALVLMCCCSSSSTPVPMVATLTPMIAHESPIALRTRSKKQDKIVSDVTNPNPKSDVTNRNPTSGVTNAFVVSHAAYHGEYGMALTYAVSPSMGRFVDLVSRKGNKKRATMSWLFS
jgi:hypothetical protein